MYLLSPGPLALQEAGDTTWFRTFREVRAMRIYMFIGAHYSFSDMQKGSIVVTNVSTSEPDPLTGKVTHVRSILKGRGDPGYLLTSSKAPLLPADHSISEAYFSHGIRICSGHRS
jgi:hypothetical protein